MDDGGGGSFGGVGGERIGSIWAVVGAIVGVVARMRGRLSRQSKMVVGSVEGGCVYGYEVMRATGLPSGVVYPILRRLEGAGRLVSWWEDVDPVAVGRPRRRVYRLPLAETRAGAVRPPGAGGHPTTEQPEPPQHPPSLGIYILRTSRGGG